jgi:hypothetical protein
MKLQIQVFHLCMVLLLRKEGGGRGGKAEEDWSQNFLL